MASPPRKPWGRLLATGITTAVLYTLLFTYEAEVMAAFTRTDGLYPLLPVAAAFAFSFSHGAFTAYFWEVLGVRARTAARERAEEAGAD
jgi:hypothetical protein